MNYLNGEISSQLIQYTCDKSNFDTSRDYISMSGAHLTVDEIYNNYVKGYTADVKGKLKCYKGYQMEADLVGRLKTIFGNDVKSGMELSSDDGLIKGHPDIEFNSFPGDCKSVLMDEWIPKHSHKIPRRIYFQMQAYMLYSGKQKSVVIFESRESGLIKDFWIRSNKSLQVDIQDKFHIVRRMIS